MPLRDERALRRKAKQHVRSHTQCCAFQSSHASRCGSSRSPGGQNGRRAGAGQRQQGGRSRAYRTHSPERPQPEARRFPTNKHKGMSPSVKWKAPSNLFKLDARCYSGHCCSCLGLLVLFNMRSSYFAFLSALNARVPAAVELQSSAKATPLDHGSNRLLWQHLGSRLQRQLPFGLRWADSTSPCRNRLLQFLPLYPAHAAPFRFVLFTSRQLHFESKHPLV